MCEQEVVQVLERVLDEDMIIPLTAIVFGCTTGMVGIVVGGVTKVLVARGKERTKREMAAYVSEGTLEPDKAVAILNAGKSQEGGCG